jgi:hypothetical protein
MIFPQIEHLIKVNSNHPISNIVDAFVITDKFGFHVLRKPGILMQNKQFGV